LLLNDSLAPGPGNTTAAIGKGFAIGSAALVGLALCPRPPRGV
jgi:Na+/H+-translocating membrane pyrophosphatase